MLCHRVIRKTHGFTIVFCLFTHTAYAGGVCHIPCPPEYASYINVETICRASNALISSWQLKLKKIASRSATDRSNVTYRAIPFEACSLLQDS